MSVFSETKGGSQPIQLELKLPDHYEKLSNNKSQSPDKHSHIIQKIPEEVPSADQFIINEVQCKSSMTKYIYLFVANICLVNMFYMILTAYTNGVVRTLERRFGLSSYQTGLLNSCNDIVHIMVVIFVGYFGQKGNKPRIMCVTAMFSVVSGILNASPHFLFPDDPPSLPGDLSNGDLYKNHVSKFSDLNSSHNDRIRRNPPLYNQTNPSAISSKFCQSHPDSFHDFCSKQEPGVHPAYYVFVVSQLINGVGSSAIFTLSMAYIDENSPKNKASIFIGAYTSFYSLGPVLGLFLSSVCLKLPENLLSGTSANNTDPSFIGCWWLGYLVGGVGLAFFSLLLWFHPTRDKYGRPSSKADEMKRLTCDEESMQESILAQLRDLPKAFASLLRNKLYLINLIVIVAGAYTIYGVFVNVVRYLEVHFFQTASESSIIAGALLAVTGLIGGFSGGTLISKLRLKTKGGVKLVLFLSFTFALGLVALINLECPQVKMDMTVDQSIMAHVVTNECNKDCKCPTSRTDYYPICGTDGISYFSPCIAGCSRKINDTFVNCKCISPSSSSSYLQASNGDTKIGMTAIVGYCTKHCNLLIPFIAAMFVMSFASTVAKVPSTMVTFRIVKDKERSFALGVNSFVLNLVGFIPGPMVFGKLIDSTCLLWQRTCGTTGACLLFDTKKLRQNTYGASLGVEAVTFFGNFCLYLWMRRTPIGMMTLSRQMEHIDMNL